MAKQKKIRMTLTVDADILNQVFQVLTDLAELLHQDSKIAIEVVACDEQKDLSSEDISSEDKVISEGDSQAKEDPEMELLHTEKGLRVLQGLRDIHLLDEDFQPLRLSWAKKGYLAYQIAFKLGIAHVWVVMGAFWHLSAKALKSARERAMNMPSISSFDKKIKPILG